MEETKSTAVSQTPSLPELVRMPEFYKIRIPAEVEAKIRHLCSKISSVEWSGTLFYTVEGSLEDGSLVIVCRDIYVMDIGSAAYTEFDVNPGVISYMCDHPELLDYHMGLIHSHNNMSTFFSGTDTATLREEGSKRNHFVSLIVNNAGSYTAGITRKVTSKKTVSEDYSYGTFNDEEVHSTREYVVENTEIQWNYLTICKEAVANQFLEIDERIDEIRKEKAKAEKVKESSRIVDSRTQYTRTGGIIYGGSSTRQSDKLPFEFPKTTNPKVNKTPSLFDDDFGVDCEPVNLPNEVIRSYVLQLITGAIAISDEAKIIPSKWAASMDKVFDKRFGGDLKTYRGWAESMCEFLCLYPIDECIACDEQEYAFAVATSLADELSKLPSNKYIDELQSVLTLWM